MKNLILTITIFIIAITVSLYVGYSKGKEDIMVELKAAYQEVEVLRTYKTSLEYDVVDAQRREAAFEEIVRLEMAIDGDFYLEEKEREGYGCSSNPTRLNTKQEKQ